MVASNAHRSALILVVVILLLAACSSGMERIDPEPLVMQPTPSLADESVLKFADPPDASGEAEFVTVTASDTTTLYEAAMPEDKRITVTIPPDGKLLISTRWTEGRTLQEFNASETGLAPGSEVMLEFNATTNQYEISQTRPSIPPALATIERITVFDRAGQKLYSGPAVNGLILYTTDGMLTVVTELSDGTSTRQDVPYDKGMTFYDEDVEYIQVNLEAGSSGQFFIKPTITDMLRSISLGFISGQFADTPPTVGVVTGDDRPLLEGSDAIGTLGFTLGLTFNKFDRFIPSLEVGALRGDDETNRELDGVNSGWAYQGGESPGGAPGLASTGGTRANLQTDYSAQNFRLTLSDRIKLEQASQAGIDYSFGLLRSERDYRGFAALTAFPDITSTDNQKITEYDFGLGLGLRGRHTFTDKWSLSGQFGLDAIYYRGDYDGNHQYDCALCAPSDQNFFQTTSDKVDGFTWGTRLAAKASYTVQPNSELFLGLDYRYQDEAPVLRNRVAPSDPAPNLATDRLDWLSIRLGFNHRY